MLTFLENFDILYLTSCSTRKANIHHMISPGKSAATRHSRFPYRGFSFGGAGYTLPNNANRVGWLAGKNRLGSVWNFTTKDMAAKAVPDQTAPASEPSRHIVAVVTRRNVAWKECPDIGFNVDSGRSINRPSELSTSLRRRWC